MAPDIQNKVLDNKLFNKHGGNVVKWGESRKYSDWQKEEK